MKNVRLVLEDAEYEKAIKKKGNMSWHDILMKGVDTL